MIRINLLPLAERQSKWPVTKLMIAAGLFVMLIFSCIFTYNLFAVWNLEQSIQTTRNQYQALQPTRVLMDSANAKQQQFDKKNNIVATLTKERQSLYNVIQHLSAQASSEICFTDLLKTDKGVIQIKGWTTTYPLVAAFMQTIENDQFFMEPLLNNVEQDANTQITKFDIAVKPRGL